MIAKAQSENGFECSGCAWPNPDKKRSHFEFCESGAKNVSSEAGNKTISVDFFKRHSITQLSQQSEYWLEQQGRLTHPMIRKPGSDYYEAVSWEDAYAVIADNLKNLKDPDEAVFYVSGRASNEASFLIQLLARMFGTNNLPNSANLCHDPSGVGLKKSLGFGKGSVGLDDFPKADSIFVFGQNPGSNHPRMLKSLQAAARNSCKIVAVNPVVEPSLLGFSNPQELSGFMGKTTKLASLYLQPRSNGDMALIKGMMKIILENAEKDPGIIDHAFIETYTSGFEEFSNSVKTLEWDTILESSGLSYQEIAEAAGIYMSSKNSIVTWCLGITQHVNSVATIQEIANLLLLKGNIGKPGAGVCPVRGHSNVQGNRTLGVGENMPDAFINKLEERFQFKVTRKKGLDAVSCIKAMQKEKVKVMISLGGNLAAASPDTEYTSQAMGKCDLTVMVSTKLNRNHLLTGKTALILPCLSRAEKDIQNGKEQEVLIESSMAKAEFSFPHIKPCSPHLHSEIRIIAEIARAVLQKNNSIDWEELASDYSKIRKLFTEMVPDYSGYDEKSCKKQGFYLYNPLKERVFKTDTGKAKFSIRQLNTAKCKPDELMLMSVRSHDQFNTGIFGLSDRYRGIKDERRVAFMNKEDMKALGIKAEQLIDISGKTNGKEKMLKRYFAIPHKIKKGSIAVYFPEANILFPIDHHGVEFPTPAFKSLPVRVKKECH
ncbi:MAG: FdhF/YdeP family oxidoreductase [Bacteroidota bacterium]|nr:FdhF/YdeP family oxidoreductase [Bacteroidota bacterium]